MKERNLSSKCSQKGGIIQSEVPELLHCQSNFLDFLFFEQKEPKKNVGLLPGSLSGNEAVKPMKLSNNVEVIT